MPECIDRWPGGLLMVGWMKQGRKGRGDGRTDGQMIEWIK